MSSSPSHDHLHPGRTAVRPIWRQLPSDLRHHLDRQLHGVRSAKMQSGGFSPGVAARLTTGRGAVFVKAIPDDHPLAAKYQVEADTGRAMPAGAPAPSLLWSGHACGWTLLVFTAVDGHHPDLAPGSADISATVTALASLADLLTPSPMTDAPHAGAQRGAFLHGWAELATAPSADLGGWERLHLHRLAALEREWTAHADGATLIHGDIRPDNMLITPQRRLMIVDWAQPCRGAAWQDLADLIPHLIMAGHTPAEAEKTLVGAGAWDALPAAVATSYAVAYAGYWTRSSRLPAPPGVPNLRRYQAHAARAALAWAMYRTAW